MLLVRPLLVAAAVVGVLAAPATAADFPDAGSLAAAADGAAYLASQQKADGSFEGASRSDLVGEALIALAAAGGQQAAIDRAIDYLEDNAWGHASSGPYTGRIVSGLVAAGEDPRDFADHDFLEKLDSYYNAATGSYGGSNLYGDTLAMAAVMAAGEDLPIGAENRLRLNQCQDGGWSWALACQGQPDTDTTSMATAILAAVAGPQDADVRQARQWLLDAQQDGGCWRHNAEATAASSNSCGLALSAIVTLGEDPGHPPWAKCGGNPPDALAAMQLFSGAWPKDSAASDPDPYATIQAIPGMAGWSYAAASQPENLSGSGAPTCPTTTTSTSTTGDRSPGSTTSEPRGEERASGASASRVEAPTPWSSAPGAPNPSARASSTSTPAGALPSIPWENAEVLGAQVRQARSPLPSPTLSAVYAGDGSGGIAVAGVVAAVALAPPVGGLGWVWRRRRGLQAATALLVGGE